MSIDRTTLFQGPGHLIFNGAAILAADDITVSFSAETEDIVANGYGAIGRRRKDRKITVTCTPLHWDNTAALLPYAALQIGESAYGTTDKALQIAPRNGANSGLTLLNAAVTKMPPVHYGAVKRPLGQMTFTALLKNSGDPASLADYWTASSVAALPAPDVTKIRNGIYTADWGAITGIAAAEGFDLDTDLSLEPTTVDGYGTVDMHLAGLTASVSFMPVNAALAGILAAQSGAIGSDPVKNDLIIKKGEDVVATIPGCQLLEAEAKYGNASRRIGALRFRSVRSASAGALAPLWTLV